MIALFAIPHVCASDLNETDVISDDGVDAINEVSDEDNQLSSDDCLSFSDLQSLIDESSSGDVIYLSNDYAYDSDVDDEDLFSGINFERDVEEDSEGYTELFCLEIYGDGHTIYGNGARIFRIAETSFIKIYDLQFVNVDEVFFYYGGAVCNYGYATFTGCSFYNNNVDNDGGAIYNSESGTLYIYDCVFEGNSANNGGAIYNLGLIHSFKEDVDYEGDIPESSFNSNFAYNCGGAIYNEEYATLDYFSFYDNAADKDGGAVYNSESGDISVYESKFYGNAAVNGGSIFNMNCSSVYDSSFSNNRADKSGGAIYNYYDDNTFAVCDVQASKFENNVANRGGAIYNAIVNDCRFTNNTAHKYGSNI